MDYELVKHLREIVRILPEDKNDPQWLAFHDFAKTHNIWQTAGWIDIIDDFTTHVNVPAIVGDTRETRDNDGLYLPCLSVADQFCTIIQDFQDHPERVELCAYIRTIQLMNRRRAIPWKIIGKTMSRFFFLHSDPTIIRPSVSRGLGKFREYDPDRQQRGGVRFAIGRTRQTELTDYQSPHIDTFLEAFAITTLINDGFFGAILRKPSAHGHPLQPATATNLAIIRFLNIACALHQDALVELIIVNANPNLARIIPWRSIQHIILELLNK